MMVDWAEIDQEDQQTTAPLVVQDRCQFLDRHMGEENLKIILVEHSPDSLVRTEHVYERIHGIGVHHYTSSHGGDSTDAEVSRFALTLMTDTNGLGRYEPLPDTCVLSPQVSDRLGHL